MATVTKSPIAELQALGQSVWLDNISREILNNGALRRLIEEDGLQGVTSNPTIFDKAITHSADYDDAIKTAVAAGSDADAIYQTLTIADIQEALDLFRPLYDRLKGGDGFVSLEVSPYLAHETAGTTSEAQILWNKLGRPNASDDQYTRHARGAPGHRGMPLLRPEHQRHSAVQRRSLRGRRPHLHPAPSSSARADGRQPVDAASPRSPASSSPASDSEVPTNASRPSSRPRPTPRRRPSSRSPPPARSPSPTPRAAYASFQKIFSGPEWDALAAKGAEGPSASSGPPSGPRTRSIQTPSTSTS